MKTKYAVDYQILAKETRDCAANALYLNAQPPPKLDVSYFVFRYFGMGCIICGNVVLCGVFLSDVVSNIVRDEVEIFEH